MQRESCSDVPDSITASSALFRVDTLPPTLLPATGTL